MASEPATPAPPPALDQAIGMQLALLLEIGLRLLIWSLPLAVSLWLAARFDFCPTLDRHTLHTWPAAWDASQRCVKILLLYNVAYLTTLLAIRALVPSLKPGRYPTNVKRPDKQLLLSCVLGILTKARYQAPFPAIFVSPLSNIIPFRWLFNLQFGPKTHSVFFVDPNILDPSLISIGRNVTIGFGTTITAHLQERDAVSFKPVIIEDDVLIGGHCALAGNIHIKKGAVIRGYSLVLPGTVIGENEFWAGIPARRQREIPKSDEASAS